MKLDISYAEFSLLRDLVKAEQMRIWKDEWVPRLRKNMGVDEISTLFHKKMEETAPEPFQNFLTNRGCCAMLLHRFEEMEKELQEVIK